MTVRVVLAGAACGLALNACGSQRAQTGVVPGTRAIAPCTGGQQLVVGNTSREAVRLIAEPIGDPHTSGASRGGYTEIGRVSPGTEDTFSIGGNVRAIWIESIDLPRNLNGSYRVIKGILFECVAASS